MYPLTSTHKNHCHQEGTGCLHLPQVTMSVRVLKASRNAILLGWFHRVHPLMNKKSRMRTSSTPLKSRVTCTEIEAQLTGASMQTLSWLAHQTSTPPPSQSLNRGKC